MSTRRESETATESAASIVYFTYTDRNDTFPYFRRLTSKAEFERVTGEAREAGHPVVELQTACSETGLPCLVIACVSDHRISPEEAARISQSALRLVLASATVPA